MGRRYLLYKFCKDRSHHLITWLTASNLDEANQAVKLLRKKYPEAEDLILGDGEFFEIIDESHLKSGEWDQAIEDLASRKSGLHVAVARNNED